MITFRKNKYLWLLIIFAAACGNKDNILDSSSIPFKNDNVILNYTAKRLDRVRNFTSPVNLGESFYLELGKYKSVESKIWMQFKGFPEDVEVISAYLKLVPNHVYGEGNTPFTAGVYEPIEMLTNELEYDLAYYPEDYGSFEVSSTNEQADSVFIDPQLINRWVEAGIDTLNEINKGMLVVFNDDASFLKEYYSLNTAEIDIDKIPKLYFSFIREGVIRDSIYAPYNDVFLIKGAEPDTTSEIILSNFDIYRSILFFDVSDIPKSAVVNKALLHIDNDPDFSNVKSFEEVMISTPLLSADWDSAEINTNTKKTGTFTRSGLEINIQTYVRNWVNGSLINNGILLYSETEGTDARYFKFKKTQTDTLFSPRLEIYYSVPPEKHFEK
ncbi:DNRLRE domain-containing protein [candidate division KSB1 bacterium]